MTAEFEKLTVDVKNSLETPNRERFTQRLTAFRMETRGFLVAPQ